MNPVPRRAAPAAAGLAVFLCGLVAAAQDYTWVETRFHRVHLRNGNFIDGKVLEVTDREVQLRLQSGEMTIRSLSIDRIELMKMRSLMELPKLDPPLKRVPVAPKPAVAASRLRGDRVLPAVSDELKSNVEMILQRLRVAKNDQKGKLVMDLASQPNVSPYLAFLMPNLEDEACYHVRTAIMQAKDPSAVPFLLDALDSDRAFVQIHTLALLSVLGDSRVFPVIRRCLTQGLPAIKAAAMDALQQLGDVDSIPQIADLLDDPDDMVRVAAINAALDLGKKARRMEVVADQIRRALPVQAGRPARDLLGAAARSGSPELWRPVSEFLRHEDPALRRAAAEALCVLAARESSAVVAGRLRMEDDPRTLVTLSRALGILRDRDAVPALIDLLRHSDENVVRGAAAALRAITGEAFEAQYDRWFDWWTRAGGK